MYFFDQFEFHMDFSGQRLADNIYHVIFIVTGCISLIVGYIYQEFVYVSNSVIGALAAAFIICAIPWPIYRRNPLKWQKTKIQSHSDAEVKANSPKKK